MTTPPLKDHAGQAKDFTEAMRGIADMYDNAVAVDLQTSDQDMYGFTISRLWEDDGGDMLPEYLENVQESFGDLLTDLDWNGVVGEDKHGLAHILLAEYRSPATIEIAGSPVNLEELVGALRYAGSAMQDAYEAFEHFTCTEANALAELFVAAGMPHVAESIINGHRGGDEEGDEHYDGEIVGYCQNCEHEISKDDVVSHAAPCGVCNSDGHSECQHED